MKRITLLITAIVFSVSMLGQSKFTLGPQIGYAASNLSLNISDITNDLKNNFQFGIFARYGNKIYFQPEVNWTTSGSIFKYPAIGDASPVTQEINIKSIQVPLSLGWRIINLKVVNIRIYTGITPSFVTDVTINTQNGAGTDYLVPEDFDNVNWQYQVGAGVDVLFLALNVSWMGGINNTIDSDITFDGQTISSKSNMFQVTLGWKIF